MSLAFVVLVQGLAALATPGSYPVHGIYGSRTVALDRAYFTAGQIAVRSPDGGSKVVADGHPPGSTDDGQGFTLTTSGTLGAGKFPVASGPNQEMMWSPDSRAFFVTADNGGIIGDYELTVVGRHRGRLVRRDLTQWLAREFGHPVRCFDPEQPNIAGISWLNGSRRLLVAAQIPNHSNCDAMGTFTAYIVDPFEMRVKAKLNQRIAKKRFGYLLGAALWSAEDGCDNDAPKCWIRQLHERGMGADSEAGRHPPGGQAAVRSR